MAVGVAGGHESRVWQGGISEARFQGTCEGVEARLSMAVGEGVKA